ncbi:MAG: UDP-N-acetylmuramoyl-tripeptide--D-alanyl-D-alanine ligase [Thermoanaerobaculia bacterium]|nr:UDP-N-acetylmuramoyl-tripeptide--D-alanyl-D-alanine ligase [Thermoanaerobaculia bacterium]
MRRVAEAAAQMGGTVIAGDPATVWRGAALDSRKVEGGELFFALPGEKADGHRFVADAFARGAAAAVVRNAVQLAAPACQIQVADPYAGLHDLARAIRRRVPSRHLVGVTGSAGKTTTKEILAACLATRFRTAKSPGNLNNLYGFPQALLGVPEDTEVMVAEMGMSTPGELAGVSRLGRPDVVMLLNVRPVHLENFASVAAIAEAKAEILQGLAAGGLVIANRDDAEVTRVVRRHLEGHPTDRVVWFGESAAAEISVRLLAVAPRGPGLTGSRFELAVGERRVTLELPLHGRVNVLNAVAAVAAATALGVELDALAAALLSLAPAAHRGAVVELASGATLIDDCYNSNPEALAAALESAAELAAERGRTRRVAIVGDMLELGPEAPAFHRAAGRRAAELGFEVVAVGPLAGETTAGAADAATAALPDAAAAADWAAEHVTAGDLVLVKGSRGIGLERVVERLLERVAGPGGEH